MMRKILRFTVKQWKKFNIEKQEMLTARYAVILTDHMTKLEKLDHILSKFNKKNLDSGITKFNRGIDTFKKSVDSMSGAMGKNDFTADDLWGKPTRKRHSMERPNKADMGSMVWGTKKRNSIHL